MAHSPATASKSPVVEALVAAVRRPPVRRTPMRSGMSRTYSPPSSVSVVLLLRSIRHSYISPPTRPHTKSRSHTINPPMT